MKIEEIIEKCKTGDIQDADVLFETSYKGSKYRITGNGLLCREGMIEGSFFAVETNAEYSTIPSIEKDGAGKLVDKLLHASMPKDVKMLILERLEPRFFTLTTVHNAIRDYAFDPEVQGTMMDPTVRAIYARKVAEYRLNATEKLLGKESVETTEADDAEVE